MTRRELDPLERFELELRRSLDSSRRSDEPSGRLRDQIAGRRPAEIAHAQVALSVRRASFACGAAFCCLSFAAVFVSFDRVDGLGADGTRPSLSESVSIDDGSIDGRTGDGRTGDEGLIEEGSGVVDREDGSFLQEYAAEETVIAALLREDLIQ